MPYAKVRAANELRFANVAAVVVGVSAVDGVRGNAVKGVGGTVGVIVLGVTTAVVGVRAVAAAAAAAAAVAAVVLVVDDVAAEAFCRANGGRTKPLYCGKLVGDAKSPAGRSNVDVGIAAVGVKDNNGLAARTPSDGTEDVSVTLVAEA